MCTSIRKAFVILDNREKIAELKNKEASIIPLNGENSMMVNFPSLTRDNSPKAIVDRRLKSYYSCALIGI